MSVLAWASMRFLRAGLLALGLGVGILICIDGVERSQLLGQGVRVSELLWLLLARLPLVGREVLGFFLVLGCLLESARMRDRREWLGLASVGVGPEWIASAASLSCGGLALTLGLGLEMALPWSQSAPSEVSVTHGGVEPWSLVDGKLVSIGEVKGNRLTGTRIVHARDGRLTGIAQEVEASWNGESWEKVGGRSLAVGPGGGLESGTLSVLRLPAPDVLSVVRENRTLSELSMRELSLLETERARAWWHLRVVILLAPFFWCWGFSRSLLHSGRGTPWRVLTAGLQVGTTQLGLVLLAVAGAPVLWIWIGFGGLVCVPVMWGSWPTRTGRRSRAFPMG